MFTFSEEAMQIAIDNELTMMGTSDVHVLIDWDFNIKKESYHRPITFIIAEKTKQLKQLVMHYFKEILLFGTMT